MSKLNDAIEQLIEAVLDSPEYREYDEQRNKMNQYPELKAKTDEFRERTFLIQYGDEDAFEKMEQLDREYSDFLENPLVSDFLEAEVAFCRMIQDMNLRLTEAVNFE